MQKHCLLLALLIFPSQLSAQAVTDPLPYAEIAVPIPDTMDQLKRDSINLRISPIRINQAGYRPQDDKYFYYVGSGAPSGFKVINKQGESAGSGTFTATTNTSSGQFHIKASNNAQLVTGGDTRYILDSKKFSGTIYLGQLPTLSEGIYRVVVGSDTSADFSVNEKLYSWVRNALLKFYGVNRCGNDNSWFHPACHMKDEITGGWHDCGDHLKEGITIGHTAAVLGLSAAAFQDRDEDAYSANQGVTLITDGIPDILYEAKHGSDYILNSYDHAGGNVSKMITSMADFGQDHMWWGRPEYQDKMPQKRGGPVRAARNEVGGNIIGDYATNLAFVSKVIKIYDKDYSDRCLKAAKDLYAFAINNQKGTETPAYNGCSITNDELALAASALIWATGDKKYLNDLCFDKTIGSKGNTTFPKFSFEGGWFANQNVDFTHGSPANTDWASVHVYALWSFFRLVLNDENFCTTLGLSDSQRKSLIEKTVYNLIASLGHVGVGDQTIVLPSHGGWAPNNIKYELPWMTMLTQQEWVWNRYQAGNITEMYCYYDIATKIQGMELPNTPASTDWKAADVKKVFIRQMDYMFGVNPWDISMVYGVGNKNFNHPHHRAANPEGKNVAGAFYKYSPPVGALQGGYKPTAADNLYSEHYDDYRHSETGIDGTSALFLPVAGLAKEEIIGKPAGTVRTVYVGCESAIIEVRQSRFGNSTIQYGTGASPDQTKKSDSAAIIHRIELTGLKNGTVYNFNVIVSDLFGRDSTVMNVDEEGKSVLFTFTTLQNCPSNAEISNVKVCKVTSDSAEIFWYTPNGEFDSKIVYGTEIPPAKAQSGDVAGVPVKFHYMKIGGLKEQTTYYFYVQSGTSIDDNSGAYYKFTTPVEHVNFDIRALRYKWSDMTALGMNIINQDSKAYDSLDVRIYFRAKDDEATNYTFENDLAARLDIGIVYDESGFQAEFGENSDIRNNISSQKPIKMEDTYNEKDGTYAYYLSIPLWGVEMKSGSRIRVDVLFDRRSPFAPYLDLMNQAAKHEISDSDWSFGPHSVADGEPFDYPGVPEGAKNDVDDNYWNLPVNYYMTVYRKGEFVWGYSPSKEEQSTKKTVYEMKSQVTSPVNNPSEDYFYTLNSKIDVVGHAVITPADGKINDIWVNGAALANPSSYAVWNSTKQWYDYAIPVKLKNGRNPVDIVIFAGPSSECTDCYGCANAIHSFYVESGAQLYPSTISLKDENMVALVNDTAHIDTSKIHIVVSDRNGNLKGKSKDVIYVTVINATAEDTLKVTLTETGDSTGIFQTASPVAVVNLPASQTGSSQIAMSGGEKITFFYMDPTDSSDISETYLVSKADFPLAKNGAFFDSDGDGSVDKMVVSYSIELKIVPDSINFGFPSATDMRTLRKGTDTFTDDGNILTVTLAKPLDACVTAYTLGTKSTARSFLESQGVTKVTPFTLYDSTGPVISADVILHEKIGSGDDTITVAFSESVNLDMNVSGVMLLLHNGQENKVTVAGIIEQTDNTMKMVVSCAGGISDGDSLFINSSGTLTDMANNHAHMNNPKRPISIREAPPTLVSAYYTADKNGCLDKVVVKFVKKINSGDLSVTLKWADDKDVDIDKSKISQVNDTIVQIDIRGLLTGSKVVTSGSMKITAKHAKFSDNIMKTSVFDMAAPVIMSAVLRPSSEKTNGNYIDTLTVVFSEEIENINAEKPFTFMNMPSGASYSMILENSFSATGDASRQIFYVSSYEGVEFPDKSDSIRIDVAEKVIDRNGNAQKYEDNRYAPMTSMQIPFTVSVKSGPNPFTPTVDNDNIRSYSDAADAADEGKGIMILFTPDTTRIKSEVNLGGTIDVTIFDAFGNIVRKEKCLSDENKSNVYFFWDGRNRNGRIVGAGTYVVDVKIKNEGDIHVEEVPRFKVSVKR